MEKSKTLRVAALAVFVVAVVTMLVFFPVAEELQRLLDWVRDLGDWGLVVVAAAYIPATVLFVPGTILSLAWSLGPQTCTVLAGIANGMPAISILLVTL